MIIRKRLYVLISVISILVINTTVISLVLFQIQVSKVKQRSAIAGQKIFREAIQKRTDVFITHLAREILGKDALELKSHLAKRLGPRTADEVPDYYETVFVLEDKKIIYSPAAMAYGLLSDGSLLEKQLAIAERGGGDEFIFKDDNIWFCYVTQIPASSYWYSILIDIKPMIHDYMLLLEPTIQFFRYASVGIITVAVLLIFFIQAISYPVLKRVAILEKELTTKNEELSQANLLLNVEVDIRKNIENELKVVNNELKRTSITDSLTKLSNRRHFDHTLKKEWNAHLRAKRHISLLMCDIDFFKKYNDTYGHQKGDHCLTTVASVLKKECHRPSDIVARYGGEEFVIILPETDPEGAINIADKVRLAVENRKIPHSPHGGNKYITISIGIASMVPDIINTEDTLIKQADEALYKAKEAGRNRWSLYG